MPSQQQTGTVNNFRGLNEHLIRGSSMTETSSLDNVTIRDGIVHGRRGSALWGANSTPSTGSIRGLWQYYHASDATGKLVRMTPTKLEAWDAGTAAWIDITGTALAGASNARPQAVTFAELDSLIFTNEGGNRPRKWIGSSTSVELGGTPPFAKALESYVGFLGLGNISADGSTYRPYDLIFSDAPDGIWEECDDTEVYVTTLILDETPGEIRAMRVLGPDLLVYKSDCIINIKFSLGVVRFVRKKLDFDLGILAPLSLQNIPGTGQHFFLGTDRRLYFNNGSQVQPFPPNVQKSLQNMLPSAAPYCRSAIDPDAETYTLFYQRSGSSFMDGRIDINYHTKEFTRGIYPYEVSAATSFRANFNEDSTLVVGALNAAGNNLVYELDVTTTGDDAGTTPSRYYDIDWTQFGSPGNKWFTGGEFTFKRATYSRVRFSVAVDNSSKFTQQKTLSLRGNLAAETETRVQYNIAPVFGSWFKIRIEMFQDSTDIAELVDFQPEFVTVNPTSEDAGRQHRNQRA